MGFELGTDGPDRILVGVDGSDTSMRAGAYAAGLARRQGSELIVLFVATTAGMASGLASTASAYAQTMDELGGDLERVMAEAAGRLAIKTSFLRRKGNPYVELVKAAADLRVDAIVVGASTQAGHRLVGSLAGRLVKDAKWPITVVP